MFTACIFCHSSLGRNEAVEHFPVGRRLAFDAAKGRLWVVCARCQRWNLTPLEERWEAIEECERLYRSTRLRASTEQIGLARVGEGTELVRIGRPERPEMAAWRYGPRLVRRRRRALLLTGAVVVAGGAIYAGAISAGIATVAFGGWAGNLWSAANRYRKGYHWGRAEVATVRGPAGEPLTIRGHHLPQVRLVPSEVEERWMLRLPHEHGVKHLRGPEAVRAAGVLLSRMNRYGASSQQVRESAAMIERWQGPERFLQHTARDSSCVGKGLIELPTERRLALEMAASEELERQALEGELALLERAWREAEEIAAIADDMFLPAAVTDWIRRWRTGGVE